MSIIYSNPFIEKIPDRVKPVPPSSPSRNTPAYKHARGLLLLQAALSKKTYKKAYFSVWKYYCHRSLYALWKDLLKEEPRIDEFEVVLKVLHKRKAEVDEIWAMMKTQEDKYEVLYKRNRLLEERNKDIQGQIPEYYEKSVQVNFLQDSMLKRTHMELEQLEMSLNLKEKQLKCLENCLKEKFDQMNIREKNLHQKEASQLCFNELESHENLLLSVYSFKSQIFPEYIEENLWLQLVDPSRVTSEQLQQLQEYEKYLFAKHEELSKQKTEIISDLKWISDKKSDLDSRELKIIGLEDLKQDLESQKEDLKQKYEEITQATEELELSLMQMKSSTKKKPIKASDWGIPLNDYVLEDDSLDYLKIGLEELVELQKKGVIEENLTDVVVENIVTLGENLIQAEKDFYINYKSKTLYIEHLKNELEEIKTVLELEKNLIDQKKTLENEENTGKAIETSIESLETLQNMVLAHQTHTINNKILEIEQKELEIKKLEYDHDISHYTKLNTDLECKITQYNTKIFEMKSILSLLFNITPGNTELFKQEISRVLIKYDTNPEINNKLKIIMTLYLWLSRSYTQSSGKHLLLVKISFYLLRMRAIMLKQGLAIAPVYFSTPPDFMWLEVLWLRAKHYYFNDIFVRPELVSLTKHWFAKFIMKKLSFSFDIMKLSYTRMARSAFYHMRNHFLGVDKKKTQILFSNITKIEEKPLIEIRKEVNIKAACRILPFFEKFNRIWSLYKKIYIIKWKEFSITIENIYYQHTIHEIYSNVSELMHKEHKFKEQCKIHQSALRNKVHETSKLLDKVLC